MFLCCWWVVRVACCRVLLISKVKICPVCVYISVSVWYTSLCLIRALGSKDPTNVGMSWESISTNAEYVTPFAWENLDEIMSQTSDYSTAARLLGGWNKKCTTFFRALKGSNKQTQSNRICWQSPVSDWLDSLIGPSGLLLVVSDKLPQVLDPPSFNFMGVWWWGLDKKKKKKKVSN